jgi:hypothetical protein
MIWDQGIYTYGNDDMDPVEGLAARDTTAAISSSSCWESG